MEKLLKEILSYLEREEWGRECVCGSCGAIYGDLHYDDCEWLRLKAEVTLAIGKNYRAVEKEPEILDRMAPLFGLEKKKVDGGFRWGEKSSK